MSEVLYSMEAAICGIRQESKATGGISRATMVRGSANGTLRVSRELMVGEHVLHLTISPTDGCPSEVTVAVSDLIEMLNEFNLLPHPERDNGSN